MGDFYLNLLWTGLVTTLVILMDLLAGKFVAYTRGMAGIERAITAAGTDRAKLAKVEEQLLQVRTRQVAARTWGAELVTAAVSLDLAVLSLWLADRRLFPFFQKWNDETRAMEVQVWLLLLVMHVILLLLSVYCRHRHGEKIESLDPRMLEEWGRGRWFGQNGWMLANNTLGMLTLLSCFVIITNSV
jgi:hypothetical protein